MTLLELLSEFKKIQPDTAFTATSKRVLLAMEPEARVPWTARRTILRLLETGFAVALTGFFVLLVAGGLSGSKLAPVRYSAFDPDTLRAEAEAIDIQIQLANLNYEGGAAESTMSITGLKKAAPPRSASPLAPPAAESTIETTSTATSTSLSIDQALEGLAN